MLLGFLSEKSCDICLCWAEFSASAMFSLVLIVHDVWDVSVSFLNDHLEETRGPTKIGENHSKCINLTQVSVLS